MTSLETEGNCDQVTLEVQEVTAVPSTVQPDELRRPVSSTCPSVSSLQAVDVSTDASEGRQQQILQISPGQFVQILSTSTENGETYLRCQPVIGGDNFGEEETGISVQTVLGNIPHGYQIVSLPQSIQPLLNSTVRPSSPERCGADHHQNQNNTGEETNVVVIQYDKPKSPDHRILPDVQDEKVNRVTRKSGQKKLRKKGQPKIWEPTVTVQISENDSLSLPKFYFHKSLCRVCLLEKELTISIFENMSVDDKGVIENSKGPKAVRYNIIPALKTLLDVEVKVGDGLPTQICVECLDRIIEFSAFRRRVAIGQEKLRNVITQVSGTNNPTILISMGEPDYRRTDMFKHPEWILQAKNILATSGFCHLVQRRIPDRVWDKMFSTMSDMMGAKSNKLALLEKFVLPGLCTVGWFCANCNMTIHDGDPDKFEAHCLSIHGINKHDIHLPCDVCGNAYPFKDTTGLSQSYADHWLQHFYFYECGECSKRFPSHKSLWGHAKTSHRLTKDSSVCDVCHKPFSSKSSLESHKKTHMDKEERLPFLNICNLCGKGLTGNLQTHMNSVHFDKRLFKCEVCAKTFTRKETLASHRTLVHLNIKKYKCDTCGKCFKSSAAKHVHGLRHTGEKPHFCLVSDCGQSFYSPKALRSHALKHQEIGAFKCTECGKFFKRKRYLEEHSTLHTGVKPYECPHCGKQIRMKSNFYKHLKIHERKTPADSETAAKESISNNSNPI